MWRVRQRLRSPLRWLSAGMSALFIFAMAGVLRTPALIPAAFVVAGLFLFAPPLGIYRHDETPAPRASLTLAATPLADDGAGGARYLLTLINPGDVTARDFRVRLIVPATLAPPSAPVQPLARLCVGTLGEHWFTEHVQHGTALTFRAGGADAARAITCPAGGRVELAELRLLNRGRIAATPAPYQINGGNTGATLSELRLPPP